MIRSHPRLLGFLFIGILVFGAGTVGIVDGNTQSEVSHTTPETVAQDGTFEFTVETTASAGTIIKIDSGDSDRDITVSTDEEDAVKVSDNRIEFIDPTLGDSQYNVTVDHSGGTSESPIEVSSWTNAEQQSEADDSATETIDIQKRVTIVDPALEPENVNSAPEHTLLFDVDDVSADNTPDNISIAFPSDVKLGSNPEIRVDGESLEQNKVEKQGNKLLFSINPSSDSTTEDVSVEINVELSSTSK